MADKAPPSLTAVAIAVGLIGLTAGYFLGQGSSVGLFDRSRKPKQERKSWPNSYDVTIHPDSSDEELQARGAEGDDDEDNDDEQELNSFDDNKEEVKLVLAVRTDLGMTKGVCNLAS